MKKTEIITFMIEPEIKKDLAKLAKAEGRSVSNKIQHLIKTELIKNIIRRKDGGMGNDDRI